MIVGKSRFMVRTGHFCVSRYPKNLMRITRIEGVLNVQNLIKKVTFKLVLHEQCTVCQLQCLSNFKALSHHLIT